MLDLAQRRERRCGPQRRHDLPEFLLGPLLQPAIDLHKNATNDLGDSLPKISRNWRNFEDDALEARMGIRGRKAGRAHGVLQCTSVSYVEARGGWATRTWPSKETPSTVREGQLRQIASLESLIWRSESVSSRSFAPCLWKNRAPQSAVAGKLAVRSEGSLASNQRGGHCKSSGRTPCARAHQETTLQMC